MLIQIVAAKRVVNSVAARGGRIIKSGTVFRDVERDRAVAILEPAQQVLECRRVYFPTGFRVSRCLLCDGAGAQWPSRRIIADDVAPRSRAGALISRTQSHPRSRRTRHGAIRG